MSSGFGVVGFSGIGSLAGSGGNRCAACAAPRTPQSNLHRLISRHISHVRPTLVTIDAPPTPPDWHIDVPHLFEATVSLAAGNY